ncbi:hypothetical protein F3J24_06990 [Comamonas sp. Tr-654]|uniref:hypothetical protein n=1 Tax=Comamonas sp. Tr-654 TaxID=2608341 RepID=UPI00141E9AA6|nr:hypothetical protein [Comamonas sp. Tr-654]NIF83245.1 hypothetical protein [Comamonas sp. Tr-654]
MQRLAWLRVLQRSRPTSRLDDTTRHHGLTHAVSSALSERRTDVLRHLVDRHAAPLMASAMANLSTRQRADALSLLTREQRSRLDEPLRASQAQKPWTLH